jgi:hypothetical protein
MSKNWKQQKKVAAPKAAAKTTKVVNAAVTAEVVTNAPKLRNTIYRPTGAATPAKALAPQALVIFNIIHEAGDRGISKSELVGNLKGILKTKQPVERVLAYYSVLLKKDGLLATTKA